MTSRLQQKLCTADEAAALIPDGATLASGGFVGAGHAEAVTGAIERRFLARQGPRGLTLVYAAGQGDGKTRGLNHLAHEGLTRRVIGGHWALAPRMGKLAVDGKIEAFNFPQGVVCQLFRDIAAGRPGCITHIGLGTYIDPDHQSGCINERAAALIANGPKLVERIELGGKPWLWYKSFPIHVGLIRGTAADPLGNLVLDDEVLIGEVLAIAQAVHNSAKTPATPTDGAPHGHAGPPAHGLVIAQVKRLLDKPANPQQVRVPGVLIDRIVLADDADHEQTFAESFNPAYCSASAGHETSPAPLPLDERRIIAARACDELPPGAIANLGIGMPEGVARIAAERGLLDTFTLTVESGPIGGMPAGGLSFGASVHPHAIVDQPAQFDFYDGRGLDFAALGAAQIDAVGNVNVSKFGPRVAGVGGFVNISQTARRLVFCGTFTTGGLEVAVENGRLRIAREGSVRKFVGCVEQLSFSALRSREIGQEVLYVTERAVFRLVKGGIELIEVAPGIDLERDILAQMSFRPIVRSVRDMPKHVFTA